MSGSVFAEGTTLPDRRRLPLCFDVELLQHDVALFEQSDWTAHYVPQNYEGQWSVIPLRGPASATHPVMMMYSDPTCTEFADTEFLKRTRYLPEVLSSFECPLDSVRLMKLTPGSRIKEHTDFDLAAESGAARLHIPVSTGKGVEFLLNGTPVPFREGECWYLRLSDPHSVMNAGASDRVHLVIDARVDSWLGKLLVP